MQAHPVAHLHPATYMTWSAQAAKVTICCADPRLRSVPAQEQDSRQHAAHSQPHLWHNNSACTPSNHRDSVSGGLPQHEQQQQPPEQCSHSLQSPCICRHQVPSTCGLSETVDDLFTRPPSQGVENDSLGLDQRMIMSELAASRYLLPLWVHVWGPHGYSCQGKVKRKFSWLACL